MEHDLAKPSAFTDERRGSYESWVAGWYKINVDGAQNTSSGITVCGSIVRDSNGGFVKGFSVNIGRHSSLVAELQALLHGMKVARMLSLKKVIFEIDLLVQFDF